MISVVLTTLNAAPLLGPTLGALGPGLMEGVIREVIFADGGSTDDTAAIAEAVGAEMRQGPAATAGLGAKGPWLLFLEAGAMLSPEWPRAVRAHVAARPDRAGWFRRREAGLGALGAAWANVRASLGRPAAAQGRLIEAAAFRAGRSPRPAPLDATVTLLRSRT